MPQIFDEINNKLSIMNLENAPPKDWLSVPEIGEVISFSNESIQKAPFSMFRKKLEIWHTCIYGLCRDFLFLNICIPAFDHGGI
jgi:hypothetical protein